MSVHASCVLPGVINCRVTVSMRPEADVLCHCNVTPPRQPQWSLKEVERQTANSFHIRVRLSSVLLSQYTGVSTCLNTSGDIVVSHHSFATFLYVLLGKGKCVQ